MGFFDKIESLGEGLAGGGDHAAVASGLMQELGGTGGIGNLIQSFQQNGMGSLVEQFASGQTGAVDAGSIQQALSGSGLIESIAQRTGIPADSVTSSLATTLPMLLGHVTSNGHFTTDGQPADNPAPEAGSLLQSALGRLL